MQKIVSLFFTLLTIVTLGQTTIDTTFTSSGKIETITYKTNGKKDKVFVYADGKIVSERLFKNNVRDGISIGYSHQKKGKIISKTSYKNGKLDGPFEIYNDTGKVMSKGNYQNGMMTGTWIYYQDNGTLNTVCNYKDGKYDGKTTKYFKNGKPENEINYSNNAKDYSFIYYYENGNKQYTGAYKNEKMFGERVCYTEDGKLANGLFTEYNEDGILIRECTCINGKPNGELKAYTAHGTFSYIVNFKDGKPDGFAIYNNGKRKELYKNGVFIKEIKEETSTNSKL